MLWTPPGNAEVEQPAAPEASATVEQPAMTLEPSLNIMVPVAVPAAPDTLAVNVTDCPTADGFADELREVVDAARANGRLTSSIHARSRHPGYRGELPPFAIAFAQANENRVRYCHLTVWVPALTEV